MASSRLRLPPRIADLTVIRPETLAVLLLLAFLGGAFLYVYDPARGGLYPTCTFHQTTGLLCPGCGGLRAAHQLLHGHLATAFYFNPLVVLSLPLAAWVGVGWLLRLCKGQPTAFMVRCSWLWYGGAVVLLFSILRNLPGQHSPWLGLHP